MKDRLQIVVPCFNEANRLSLGDFRRISATRNVSFLFVDDGSTDETAELIERALVPDQLMLLRLEKNVGKAEAVRIGLLNVLQSRCEWVGYVDADGSVPLDEIERMARVAGARAADVVLGSRVKLMGYDIQRKSFRHYVGRVFATFASMTLGIPVYDTQCGVKLLRNTASIRRCLDGPFQTRWIFDVELLARFLSEESSELILEVPLKSWHHRDGSKIKLLDGITAFAQLLHLRFKYQKRRPWSTRAPGSSSKTCNGAR